MSSRAGEGVRAGREQDGCENREAIFASWLRAQKFRNGEKELVAQVR